MLVEVLQKTFHTDSPLLTCPTQEQFRRFKPFEKAKQDKALNESKSDKAADEPGMVVEMLNYNTHNYYDSVYLSCALVLLPRAGAKRHGYIMLLRYFVKQVRRET